MRTSIEGIRAAMRPRDADQPVAPGGLPDVLYHVTPMRNLDAILASGLRPMSRSLIEDHPPRVYLCRSPAMALSLCRQIRSAMLGKRLIKATDTEDFAILAVNARAADVVFRVDGSSVREDGVYADAEIGPHAVRHVETVDGRALMAHWWPKVWNHVIWHRGPRPACLQRLGTMTGYPHYDGWRDPVARGASVPFDWPEPAQAAADVPRR